MESTQQLSNMESTQQLSNIAKVGVFDDVIMLYMGSKSELTEKNLLNEEGKLDAATKQQIIDDLKSLNFDTTSSAKWFIAPISPLSSRNRDYSYFFMADIKPSDNLEKLFQNNDFKRKAVNCKDTPNQKDLSVENYIKHFCAASITEIMMRDINQISISIRIQPKSDTTPQTDTRSHQPGSN